MSDPDTSGPGGRSERPTRQTVAGRAYLDLQNLARRQHRPTDELHELYALEGFLARLAGSPHADRLVLKGGVLLAAYDARRPTRDVDMQAREMSNQAAEILQVVREIAGVAMDDGLVFDTAGASAEVIRDEDSTAACGHADRTLSAARLSLHVDINVGDPIWPAPRRVELPRLLGGVIRLSGYPLHMIYAEKIVTAVQRGTANTRWRDFADLYLLIGRHPIAGGDLQQALAAVADYRRADLAPLSDVLDGYAGLAQARWVAWRYRHRLEDRLPEPFAHVLTSVTAFADPALRADVADRTWDPDARAWR